MILQFDNLPVEILLSKQIREKMYTKENVPDRLKAKIGVYYRWSHDGFLFDMSTSKFVLRNPRTAGTERTLTINGALLWEQGTSLAVFRKRQVQVAIIKKTLVEYFLTQMEAMPRVTEVTFPIRVVFSFTLVNDLVDFDNFSVFYVKSFMDSIQTMKWAGRGKLELNPVGFIPEDNLKHFNGFTCKAKIGNSNSLTITIK